MGYSFQIKKFLYGQHVFSGLRMSFGLALPPLFSLLVFHKAEIGVLIASGTISISVIDLPGPLKHKHNEMLACSGLGFLSALATGFATASNLTMWITVVPLTFLLSLLVVFPNHGPQISFGALFMMIINIEQHFTPFQAVRNALWLFSGSLWYTYFSYFWNCLTAERTQQQAIAEAIFATAEYIRVRAKFYNIKENLDEIYQELIEKQIATVELQESARDIVLRNLPYLRNDGIRNKEFRRVMLFNIFINSVDLHDMIIGFHTDYEMLRQSFGKSDILSFFQDLICKSATELDSIGLAVLQHRPSVPTVKMKAELRAIEYEIDKLRRKNSYARNSSAYATVVATYRRVWSVTRLIDRMHYNTQGKRTDTEISVNQALSRFLVRRHFIWKQLWTNLTSSSPSFRHAIRVTLAVAIGLVIGKALPLTNSYWIVLTTVIIMKPGFSMTRQRNKERIVGTVIGCAAALVLTVFVKGTLTLIAVMFACMFMAHSLIILHYGAATVFISAYVLLFYHVLAPAGIRLIGERAIDTMIGGLLAIGISYIYANWEYRLMEPLVTATVRATRAYLNAVLDVTCQDRNVYKNADKLSLSAFNNKNNETNLANSLRHTAIPTDILEVKRKQSDFSSSCNENRTLVPQLAISPLNILPGLLNDTKIDDLKRYHILDQDLHYRLARKNVHVAFANLGQAFLRMLREPRSKQHFVAEFNELLIQSHILASQINVIGQFLLLFSTISFDRKSLSNILSEINENLLNSENGIPLPVNYENTLSTLFLLADDMVANIEREQHRISQESIDLLKALMHQCKQMLNASQIIRRNANKIRSLS